MVDADAKPAKSVKRTTIILKGISLVNIKLIPELTPEDESRFWNKICIKDEHQCWEWTSSKVGKGYGQFWLDGRYFRSNRIALFLKTGQQEDVARHSCDNPGCCNPNHLEWGDAQDNIDDKVARGRLGDTKGSKQSGAKLDENRVMQMRTDFEGGGFTRRQLSDLYGVAYSTVVNIIARLTWQHI